MTSNLMWQAAMRLDDDQKRELLEERTKAVSRLTALRDERQSLTTSLALALPTPDIIANSRAYLQVIMHPSRFAQLTSCCHSQSTSCCFHLFHAYNATLLHKPLCKRDDVVDKGASQSPCSHHRIVFALH